MPNWFSNVMFGQRPQLAQMPGTQPYIDRIGEAGDVGLGEGGHAAKRDIKMMGQGRIEDAPRLAAVLSSINARSAADYNTTARNVKQSMAFENQPVLEAAIDSEVGDKINQNAGTQFAEAASHAYGDAESELERARQFRASLGLDAAKAQAGAYQSSLYQNNRSPGMLQGLMQQWLSPQGMASAAQL